MKLKNFPKVYCVSLEHDIIRRNILIDQFKNYGIHDINFLISKKYPDYCENIEGKYLHLYKDDIDSMRGIECGVSHLKLIRKWIKEGDDSYGFFCEDDLSLETVEYWNFNWDEFVEKLPEDWECVQLFLIADHFYITKLELKERMWDFWGATAYIMKREYAKKLIDFYVSEDNFTLNLVNETPNVWYHDELYSADPLYHKQPNIVENILFTGIGKTYNFPLFVENIFIESTFVSGGQKGFHIQSCNDVLNLWKIYKENKSQLIFNL